MKESLVPGVVGSATYLVTEAMSPAHLPTKVLSTPEMVRLIEETCLATDLLHLDDDETTVGIHICVSHVASVDAGETVLIGCELIEVDRRRLVYATTVSSDGRTVSEGTNQRFVVNS